MKASTLAGLLAAILLGAWLGWLARTRAPDGPWLTPPVSAAAAVQTLLARELPDAQGQPQALKQWRGRPLLINFWASWCGPCREEMPQLDELARLQGQHGVQLLGIAWEAPASVAAFLRETPVSYPVLVANDGVRELLAAFGNPAGGLPFSVLVDAEGRPQAAKLGAFRPGEAARMLAGHAAANGRNLK